MQFSRRFSSDGPFSGIPFAKFQTGVRNPDGTSLRSQGEIEAPAHWSQTAVDILADKYCRKRGVPSETVCVPEDGVPTWLQKRKPVGEASGSETSAKQVFLRLSGCWTYWGWKLGYFSSEEDAMAFHDDTAWMLAAQYAAPNSPQWFNSGVNWAYGVTGSASGQWYYDEECHHPCEDSYTHPGSLACFIQSVEDSLLDKHGIMDMWEREARVFKFGAGSGANFSNLRGKGEPLANGGGSSGLMSWLKTGDVSAGAIKSGGTTRRAAKLIVIDADHPDIFEFVLWKVEEESKVAALIAGSKLIARHVGKIIESFHDESLLDETRDAALRAGVQSGIIDRVISLCHQSKIGRCQVEVYTADYEGSAYCTVAGQNANNSVSVKNVFMDSVRDDGMWNLISRVGGKVTKSVRARDLFDDISYAAWSCADPGLFFSDAANLWNTCHNDGEIYSGNPCFEYLFLNDTGCNLASLNLMRFWDGKRFDVSSFRYAVRIWTIILDITTQMSAYPGEEIARKSRLYRTLGLNYTNLGAMIMSMGLAYDSDQARAAAGAVTSLMHSYATATSAEIANQKGTFIRYEANKEHCLRVIRRHTAYALGGDPDGCKIPILDWGMLPPQMADLQEEVRLAAKYALNQVENHGLRNAQIDLLAPTGTVSLLMDADTTGIEPDYSLVKFKKLAGGGYLKLVNQSVRSALVTLGYTADQIKSMCFYAAGHGTFDDCPHRMILQRLGAKLVEAEVDAKACVDVRFILPEITGLLTDKQVEEVNLFVCGRMTMEGAPHLKAEHQAVFDCATPCGHGKRSISAKGHLLMVAAALPFLSGSISKTVNVSSDTTVDEVAGLYMYAWELDIKNISIYRDGSKLSQVLNSQNDQFEAEDEEPQTKVQKIVYEMARRKPLPSHRRGYTQKLKVAGHTVYIHTGEYDDGSLGEVFIDISRTGSMVRTVMNHLAISVSIAMQYGVPLEEFVDAFLGTKYEPSGIVSGHDEIKLCTSISDAIVRDLAIHYLDRSDLVQNGSQEPPQPIPEPPVMIQAMVAAGSRQEAKFKGFEGDPCGTCQSLTLVRRGTCLYCQTCGASSGCS